MSTNSYSQSFWCAYHNIIETKQDQQFKESLCWYTDFCIFWLISYWKDWNQKYFIQASFDKKTLNFLSKIKGIKLYFENDSKWSFDSWKTTIISKIKMIDLSKFGFTKESSFSWSHWIFDSFENENLFSNNFFIPFLWEKRVYLNWIYNKTFYEAIENYDFDKVMFPNTIPIKFEIGGLKDWTNTKRIFDLLKKNQKKDKLISFVTPILKVSHYFMAQRYDSHLFAILDIENKNITFWAVYIKQGKYKYTVENINIFIVPPDILTLKKYPFFVMEKFKLFHCKNTEDSSTFKWIESPFSKMINFDKKQFDILYFPLENSKQNLILNKMNWISYYELNSLKFVKYNDCISPWLIQINYSELFNDCYLDSKIDSFKLSDYFDYPSKIWQISNSINILNTFILYYNLYYKNW